MRIILLSASLLLTGCATSTLVEYKVISDPAGAPVDVNDVSTGITPCTITLQYTSRWVGLAEAPGGWAKGNETYVVTCFPPPNSKERLFSQKKIVEPSTTPQGGQLLFDLHLDVVGPQQRIDIRQSP
jgi:hypothetical protein